MASTEAELRKIADRFYRAGDRTYARIFRALSLEERGICKCDACAIVDHASYCAVHNAPALPIGACTCEAVRDV